MNIDEIMQMLNANNDLEIQRKGIEEGKKIKNFNVFIQPLSIENPKLVWENCAVIICSKSPNELHGYLENLFMWVRDLNWPGAIKIQSKLKEMKEDTLVATGLNQAIEFVSKIDDEVWLENLLFIRS